MRIPIVLLLGLVVSASVPAGPPIPVGVARIDITPEGPIRLCGYASRQTESDGIAGQLTASALAMGGGDGHPALLITAELIGVPDVLIDPLTERLEKKTGIPRSRISICATHTHTGPCLAGFLNETHFSEFLPEDQMKRIRAYTRELLDRLESVALAALEDRRPGRLAWAQGKAAFAVNRRTLKNGKWAGFGVNPDGPVDHALPVLVATDPDGAPRAILANYACHCTTYGGPANHIHGDWAGSARRIIEERHPGVLAMISIGCGGDANPDPRGATGGVELVVRHGSSVADEVDRLLDGVLVPLPGPPECRRKTIDVPLDHVPTRAELQERLEGRKRPAFLARLLLDRLDRGESIPGSFAYPVQTWTFGDDLAMVFLPGEVVVDYSLRLKRETANPNLWVTAYANGAPCYIASKRMIGEGGYEVDDSMNNYQKATRLALEAEDLIVKAALSLLPGERK